MIKGIYNYIKYKYFSGKEIRKVVDLYDELCMEQEKCGNIDEICSLCNRGIFINEKYLIIKSKEE